MRFSLTALLSTASIVLAQDVQLYVRSASPEVDNMGLASKDEGGDIRYIFLGSSAETFHFDSTAKTMNRTFISPLDQYFNAGEGAAYLAVDPGNDEITFVNNVLCVNGSSDGFLACQDTHDQYRYSETAYQLMYEPDGDADDDESCYPVTVMKLASYLTPTSSILAQSQVVTASGGETEETSSSVRDEDSPGQAHSLLAESVILSTTGSATSTTTPTPFSVSVSSSGPGDTIVTETVNVIVTVTDIVTIVRRDIGNSSTAPPVSTYSGEGVRLVKTLGAVFAAIGSLLLAIL